MPKKRTRRDQGFPKIREEKPLQQWVSMTTAALVGGILAAIVAYEYIQARESAPDASEQSKTEER